MPRSFTHDRHLKSLALSIALIALAIPCTTLSASSLRRSAIVEAVSQARPAVVNIHGRKSVPSDYDTHAASDTSSQVNGMGTGIIIDQRGYILTNYHVVEGVSRIRVTLADESTAVAQLVAHDPKTDLAIIKIPTESQLPVIRLGTSEDLMTGETVVAVGNAYGYEHTVTQGIISALHRTVQVSDYQKYANLIQTDASINPGNSGGPLLNIDGDMIGINVAVRVGAQGIGFAIPVNEAMDVAAELMAIDNASRIAHGAVITTRYATHESRVVVESVREGSPAQLAGLQQGDVILSVDNTPVSRRLEFERGVFERQPGDQVLLDIQRDGHAQRISLALAEGSGLQRTQSDDAWETLGLQLTPVPNATFRKYQTRYRGGMKVVAVRPDSPAFQHGVRRGDILLGMHKWETISPDNIAYILSCAEFKANQPFKFYLLRGNETLYGTMSLDEIK